MLIRPSDVELLTADEMLAIDARQAKQQSDWKSAPSHGYLVDFLGVELLVLPGVFPPKDDTQLLAKHLRIPAGARVLDMGTGSGAFAIWAAQRGRVSVVATDISPIAITNAAQNVERLHLGDRVQVRLGDGFTSVVSTERFDVVIANLPGTSQLWITLLPRSGTRTFKRTERSSMEPPRVWPLAV